MCSGNILATSPKVQKTVIALLGWCHEDFEIMGDGCGEGWRSNGYYRYSNIIFYSTWYSCLSIVIAWWTMIILAKLKYHYRHHSLLVHPRMSSLSSSPLIGPDMVPRRRRPHERCYPRRSRHIKFWRHSQFHCVVWNLKLQTMRQQMTWSLNVDCPCLWHYHSNLIPVERGDWHSLDIYHSTFKYSLFKVFILDQNWTHILTLIVQAAYATLRESPPRRFNAVCDLIIRPDRTMLRSYEPSCVVSQVWRPDPRRKIWSSCFRLWRPSSLRKRRRGWTTWIFCLQYAFLVSCFWL